MARPEISTAAKSKLQEAFVCLMQKAFLSGHWKDPLADLLQQDCSAKSFALLALIPPLSTSTDTSLYRWNHEIKSHATQVIDTLLPRLEIEDASASLVLLECIINWTSFGAFSFRHLEAVLEILTGKLGYFGTDEVVDSTVDCLVAICESVTRDPVEEARKATLLIPLCLRLAESHFDEVCRLAAAIAEECTSFLVTECHQPPVQAFLGLLLRLTGCPGILGVDDTSSAMTLNAWYLITESVDECKRDSSNTDTSTNTNTNTNTQILVSLLADALVPIILNKATWPSTQTWSTLQRDLQQQFLQIRKDFLDTLLYIQRALRVLHTPSALLARILQNLRCLPQDPLAAKALIEVHLQALIIVSEEEDIAATDDAHQLDNETVTDYTDPTTANTDNCANGQVWKQLTTLIAQTPLITQDTVNAKLAISLFGSILPFMRGAEAEETVLMLLNQLQSNTLQQECLSALHQAADAEIPLLFHHQTINSLLEALHATPPGGIRSSFIKLLARLISELKDEPTRWNAFNLLIQKICNLHPQTQTQEQNQEQEQAFTAELVQVFKTPFTFNDRNVLLNSPNSSIYRECLDRCASSLCLADALLSAWASLSASKFFPCFVNCASDSQNLAFFKKFLADRDSHTLGMKLLAAWVYGMVSENPSACLALLNSATNEFILPFPDAPTEEGLEALLDAWMHFTKQTKFSSSKDLQLWIIQRISVGQLSVPLLRSFARFLCLVTELNLPASHGEATSNFLLQVLETIFNVGLSGRIGRSGIEILARVAHDISLQFPDYFRTALQQLILSESFAFPINLADRRAFLRNLGAAHTIKKFKGVLVDFCLQSRGIIE